ncbi:MAG TPA: DUF5719 family protein [Actinomycetota bacterium]
MRPKLVLLAGVALIAAAVVVDGTSPVLPTEPHRVRVAARAGVLACPIAVPTTGRSFLHLANVGDRDGQARVAIVPDQGRSAVVPLKIPARSTLSLGLHGRVDGAAAVFIRYVGAIVASHTAWLSDGAFGGSCAPAGPRRQVIAHGSTLNTETTLAVANPGNADADVSISLLVGGRRVEPETLRKFIVKAGRRRVFSMGDFAFDAGDVTTVVQADTGRVVAQALIRNAYGATVMTAGPALTDAVSLVGLGDGPRAVSIGAIGEDEDAAVEATLLEAGRQGAAPGAPPALAPSDSVRLQVPRPSGRGPVAYAVHVTAGSPIAVGGSWRRGRGDRAGLEAIEPGTRWAGVLGLDPAGQVRALLANTGEATITARLTIITPDGAEEAEVTVGPGRTLAHPLGTGRGAFAVIVDSDAPVAVALDAIVGRAERLIAVPGVAMAEPGAVAVRQDPQAGVPGRRPGT